VIIFIGIDVFTYIRILCDYSEDHSSKFKEEEDFKQDKIVIYNEILDVMRTILYIYKRGSVQKKKNRDHTLDFLESYFK